MQAPVIHVWKDENRDRSAAENMALDEALFLAAVRTDAVHARFYCWSAPALTFGYFQKIQMPGSVRRMTGGGLVEHGDDLTFTLAYPKDSAFAAATGAERYRWIHQSLVEALASVGFTAGLSPSLEKAEGPCFAAPVQWDVVDPVNGKKIAGGAQRRSRGAIIHQGSVRLGANLRSPNATWVDRFLSHLASRSVPLAEPEIAQLCHSAKDLVSGKYGNAEWNKH